MNSKNIRTHLEKIYKKFPCLNCIVRPTCFIVSRDKKNELTMVYQNNPCTARLKWNTNRRNLGILNLDEKIQADKIEFEIIKEIFNE